MSFARAQPAASGAFGRVAALAGVALLVLLFLAWLLGWLRFGTDPRVAEIRALQEEARQKMLANGGPASVTEAAASVAAMGAIREKIEALPAHLRPEVERAGGDMFRAAFASRMDDYFDAPAAQKKAVLDRQIDQEEMMRKAFEAVRPADRSGGEPRGGDGQAGGNAASGTGGRGGTRGRSEEDRNRWRKSMIDRTTPEERARYVEYRRAMEQRREQRGLPTGSR